MMARITIISLLFVMALNICRGQSYAFKVIVSKGKSEIKSGESWVSIKVGDDLQPDDEVKISENSYLGLMHASGKPVEVREAGNYKMVDLSSRISKGVSVLNKYTDFILSSEQDKRARLAATGAVHRGDKKPITILLPGVEKSDLFGDVVSLSWISPDNSKSYEVVVSDLSEDVLARFQVEGTSTLINVNEGKLKESPYLMVRINSHVGNSSEKGVIKKLTGQKRNELQNAFNEFSDLLSSSNALDKFILAGIFEEKLMLIDALTAYKEAANIAPDVEMYQQAYTQFLFRLGFKL